MKAIVKSMDDLTDFDRFNVLIIDGSDVCVYDTHSSVIEADEINKRESREWIMVDCAQNILSKYAERNNQYLQKQKTDLSEIIETVNEVEPVMLFGNQNIEKADQVKPVMLFSNKNIEQAMKT